VSVVQTPTFYQKLLVWALPNNLKEPILGDLDEEFQLLASQNLSYAKQWYVRQALTTSWRFLWRAQRGVIMFLLSLIVFVAISLMGMVFGIEISAYIDVPSLMLTVIPSVFFAMAVTSPKHLTSGIGMLFNDDAEAEPSDIKASQLSFKVLGNTALLMGVFSSIMAAVAMSSNIAPDDFAQVIGPALSVALLTLFYGVGLKVVSYVAEQKLQYRLSQLELS